MKSRYLSVLVCLLVLLVGGICASLAQDGAQPSPGGGPPMGASGNLNIPLASPTGSFNLPQASQIRNPNSFGQSVPQPYPTTQSQGFGASQPALIPGLPGQQQNPQATLPSSGSAAPQTPTTASAPERPSAIEVAFREAAASRTPAGGGQPFPSGTAGYQYDPTTGLYRNITTGATLTPAQYSQLGQPPGFLQQFGYSLFSGSVSTFAPIQDVPVGPDYILGPGDDLRINIWGAMNNALVQTVDRNGQIFLPTVGPVRVWGLSFSQADQLIRENLSRYYRSFQTSVSMGGLRTIRIYVVGEVRQPGSYTVSSLSTAINALFAAGGPVRVGSLRNIELKRNHHTVGNFDLYDFLLRGDKTRDFRLESGDTIFIPPIGPVVAIDGEVKRPAIYELNGTTRLEDLIQMAGGLTPQSYLKHVQVIRAKPNAEREVIDVDLASIEGDGASPANIEVRNGDLVKIYPTDQRIYNTITLAGVVKYPGDYELKPGMRLAELLPQRSVLTEAYLDGVELVRLNDDFTTQVMHLNLREAWAGKPDQDIILRPRDQVTVRTEFRGPASVTVGGEVKLPGTYAIRRGERLSSVIKRAGGFTDKAFFKGAQFMRRSVAETEQKGLQDFVREQEERFLIEQNSGLMPVSASPDSERIRQFNVAQRQEQLRGLASKVTLGRIVIHLDDLDKFEGTQSDFVMDDGDALTVPQRPAEVIVMGSVRNSTAIIHKEGEDVEYYVNRAGGFSATAAAKEMYVLKADGSALTGFLRLKGIDPGDAIIVPPKVSEAQDWNWMKDLATIAGQGFLGLAGLKTVFGF